jgi:hypothetical protein
MPAFRVIPAIQLISRDVAFSWRLLNHVSVCMYVHTGTYLPNLESLHELNPSSPVDMTHPRLSTVFDYADLRLHPDGTRVYQKQSNLRPGIIKGAVQNSRASWIARDAGGSGKIHKMRPRGKMKEQGASQEPEGEDAVVLVAEVEEEVEEDVEVDEESDEQGKSSKETKKRKGKPVDKREAKRQKFAIDYDYLLPKSSGSHEVETPMADDSVNGEAISLPEPSPVCHFCYVLYVGLLGSDLNATTGSSKMHSPICH